MSHHFENLLEARCAENSDVAVLRAQWDFDKRLLTSALQTVAQTFPHYSRHDGSHSHTILIQIERFLGKERLSALSATDLWLLLEAAYHHDSGMIVTNAQLEGLWTSEPFRRFLEGLRHSPDPEFMEAATRLLDAQKDPSRHLVDIHWPLQVVRAVRLVVAHFRRYEHASRSADVVLEPHSIGLQSPRTDLIPDRLFRLLGRICHAHGQDFSNAMALPHSEVGVAADVAHPRFVACMLRLGDLLDLDNGRFCPIMLAYVGVMPKSSLSHIIKHAAIRRLRIDPNVIEVEAECSADDVINGGYEACASWLECLRQELQNQQEQWTQIAPTPNFGALPSPGQIETKLRDLTSIGRIEVDTECVPRLLRGANLYREPATFVREVLQNAVDATLIRVWREHSEEIKRHPHAKSKLMAFVMSELERLPIDVQIDRIPGETPEGMIRWKIAVNDHGIGLDHDDVVRIRRVGRSNRDATRRQLLASMPKWLRPSGIFGIGLQSLFLVTPEISIDSRSFLDGKRRRLRLLRSAQNPASLLMGEDQNTSDRKFGTTVSFITEFDKNTTRFRWSYSDTETSRVLGDYDALANQELPAEISMIKDRVRNYASESWVPITLSGSSISRKATDETWHFDPNTSIRIRLERSKDGAHRGELLYRSAYVKDFLMGFLYYWATADILAETAEEILTIARDDLREDTKEATLEKIYDASLAAIGARATELREKDPASSELPEASAALLIFGADEQREHAGLEWKKRVPRQNVWVS